MQTLDKQLDAIQARADAATEGPWECDHESWADIDDVTVWHGKRNEDGEFTDENVLCAMHHVAPIVEIKENRQAWLDGTFIAASRTDVPRLAKALRECIEYAEMGEGAIRCDWKGALARILAGEDEDA